MIELDPHLLKNERNKDRQSWLSAIHFLKLPSRFPLQNILLLKMAKRGDNTAPNTAPNQQVIFIGTWRSLIIATFVLRLASGS